jgi:hypothetical protein
LGLSITVLKLVINCDGFAGNASGSMIILSDGFEELIITSRNGSIYSKKITMATISRI